MRICHIITTLDPGGAEHHLLALAGGLDRRRFEQRAVFLKGEGRASRAFEDLGIPATKFDMEGVRKAASWPRLTSFLRELRPDVVHTHLFKGDVYGGTAAERAGVARIVSTKHNEDQYLRKRLYRWVGKKVAAKARRVVCISEAVRRFFLDVAGLPASLLDVIPYGIDPLPSLAKSEGRALREELRIPLEAPLVCTIGRLTEQKGQADLVRAMAPLCREKGARLLIVGKGELEEPLRALAAELGVSQEVILSGWRADVRRVLSACDVFCLPSRWEGFGLVLLEAMREERPIVASGVGAIPEVVGDTGIVHSPGDVTRMTTAIAGLLADVPRAQALGRAGRARMEREYALSRMVDRWTRLYESLLA